MSSKKEINATKKYINVKGAREHNLKNIDVSIPKDNSPEDITLEIAIDLLNKPKKKK